MEKNIKKLLLSLMTIALLGGANVSRAGESEDILPKTVHEALMLELSGGFIDSKKNKLKGVPAESFFPDKTEYLTLMSVLTSKNPSAQLSEAVKLNLFKNTNKKLLFEMFVVYGDTECLQVLIDNHLIDKNIEINSKTFFNVMKKYVLHSFNSQYNSINQYVTDDNNIRIVGNNNTVVSINTTNNNYINVVNGDLNIINGKIQLPKKSDNIRHANKKIFFNNAKTNFSFLYLQKKTHSRL